MMKDRNTTGQTKNEEKKNEVPLTDSATTTEKEHLRMQQVDPKIIHIPDTRDRMSVSEYATGFRSKMNEDPKMAPITIDTISLEWL